MKKLLAVLLVAVMTLAGCSKPTAPTETGDPGTGTTTAQGGSITVNLGSEPPKLNPLLSTDSTSGNVIRHVYEGLVTLDQNDLPQPGVAESWEVSEDGMTYTFKLRDAKWSDGKPVTANDFAFAWKTVLTPETAAEYSYFLYTIVGGEAYNTGKGTWEDVAVKVVDDKTLEVKLIAPTPYFLSQLAFQTFMPIREDVYTGDSYGTEANNAVYNGPYMISEWVHDNNLKMTKNPEYVGAETPSLDEINFMMITDSNTAYNAYLAGDLDMVGLTGLQVQQIKTDKPEAVIDQYSDGSSWVVAFNHNKEMLKNENLRKALTLSIDRQTFITSILKNNSMPATTWTTPDIKLEGKPFVDMVKSTVVDNDLEGAKAALEEAKKELGVTEFAFELVTDDSDAARDNATYLQACFQKIGVKITITQVPFKERLERQNNGEYDLSLYGWGPDYNDPMTFLDLWVTGSGNNIIKFSDEKYDANIAAAMVEADTAKRAQMLVECEEILINGFHVAPIYYRMRDYTTSSKLTGVYRSTFQDMNFMWASVTE